MFVKTLKSSSLIFLLIPSISYAAGHTGSGSESSKFDTGRFYVSAHAGANFAANANLAGLVGGANQTVTLDFNTGYNIGGAVGYSFGDSGSGINVRTELELSYSDSNIGNIFFTGNGPAAEINVSGDFKSTNIIANGILDFTQIGGAHVTPYIGGGLGISFGNVTASYGPGVTLTGNERNLVAQALVGATFHATDHTDLFVQGNYTKIVNFQTPRLNPTGGLTGTISDDIDTLGLNVGVRFKF